MTRREILAALAPVWQAPELNPTQESKEPDVEWICPMDADVRSKSQGKCPRCGMKLVPGLPDPDEFPLRLSVKPRAWRAGEPITLRFEVLDPKSGRRWTKLLEVHEKLFHLFLISGDLEYFAHEHPARQKDGTFLFQTRLPKPGLYRVLGDFYPEGGTPQMAVKTILSAGAKLTGLSTAQLEADLAPKAGANTRIALQTEPPQPIAGLKTMLFFQLDPVTSLQPYLGAWGHLLAASADLVDLIHTHPFLADGGPQTQFNIVFPRPGTYRVWAQFQRADTVNTVAFTIPVKGL